MAQKDPYASLRFQEFRTFLVARFSMVFAWSMQFIIIEWVVYSITKNPLSLGIIGLMEVIPAVSMALFAGHIVDQKEKRNLLIKCLIAFSLISLGLFYLTRAVEENQFDRRFILYGIYGLVFLGGFVRSFIGPTLFSLIALIIPKKHYPNAATWSSSVWQMGMVLGPALAGFSISWIGSHWSMLLIFGFTLIALICLLFIKRKPILNPNIGEPVIQSLKEGLRFVKNEKAILGAISLDMIAVLFGGAVALLPIFAQDILHVGSRGFGILRAMPAIGTFATIMLSAYFPVVKKAGLKLMTAIFIFGICIIAFGLSKLFWLSCFALLASGMADGYSVVIRQTILQLKTPDNMRGRVASVNSMFVGSSNELGAFESGVTAKLMGTVTAVVFGGAMTMLTVLSMAHFIPSFRTLDLTKDVEENNEML